ncbi:MAG: hypothetical protein GVY25_16165 [Bacteroidetes bacterium]|jgi:hypothetical protein|nr:hypothetical protein [Bacteroidota bacterium]
MEEADDYQTSLRAKQASSASSRRPTDEDANAIRPGQRVRHAKLGLGVVDQVKQDEKQHVATVTFDDRGTKTLNLKYASVDQVKQDEKQHVATVTFDDRGTKTLNLKYASLTIVEDGE